MDSDRTALIVRAVLSLGRRLRTTRPPGAAGLSTIGILATLHRLGPMPAVRLAAEERLQPQSLTRVLAGLERDGMITRTPDTVDRRTSVIELTREGLDALAADIRARRRWLERAAAATLTDSERDTLVAACGAMLKLAGYAGGMEDD